MDEKAQPDEGTPRDLGKEARNVLHARLLKAGAFQIAEAYAGAVRLLATPDMPARRHLLAHLVREIAEGLPDVLTGKSKELRRSNTTALLDRLAAEWRRDAPSTFTLAPAGAAPTLPTPVPAKLVRQVEALLTEHERGKLNRRDKYARLMEALRPGSLALRPVLEPVIREWVDLVRWFQEQTHVRRTPVPVVGNDPEAELQRRFENFEYCLRGLLDGHFEVVKEIGEILDAPGSVEDKLRRVQPFLAGAEQLRYFFERLDDPAWLEPLAAADFFAEAPPALRHESSAGTSLRWPEWPASQWLARHAARSDTQATFVTIACDIPDTDNPWVRRDVADVALAVAPEQGCRLVQRLSKWLAEPKPNAPLDWSQLDQKLPALAAHLAQGGEHAQALKVWRGVVEAASLRRNPWHLRRVLRSHVDTIVAQLGLSAVAVLRDALAAEIAEASRDSIEPGSWADRSHVFRPAVEHDHLTASDIGELMGALLRAARAWTRADARRWPELVEHIESARWLAFRRVTLALLAVEQDGPTALVSARLLSRDLFDAFDRLREYRLLMHHGFARLEAVDQQRLLAWIEAGPPDLAEVKSRVERWSGREAGDDDVQRECRRWRWRRLVLCGADLPEAGRPAFAALVSEFGEGDAADVIDDTLGDTRVVDAPAAEPQFLPPHEKTADELLRALAAAVDARDAYKLVGRLGDLKFEGVRQGKALDWGEVLSLARRGLAMIPPEARAAFDPREALAALLEAGLQERAVPLDQRARMWELIESFAHAAEPIARARAVPLATAYHGWIVTQSRADDVQPERVPEVRGLLETVLGAPSAVEVHAAFGDAFRALAVFEADWLRAHIAELFPLDDGSIGLCHAAWDAYLGSDAFNESRAERSCFELLRDVYAREVERMELRPMTGRESLGGTEPERERAQRLAGHVVYLWADGTLEACHAEALIERLFANGDSRLRAWALRRLGWQLEDRGLAEVPKAVERSMRLWQQRREAIERNPALGDELPGFGSWFISGAFDDTWASEQLAFALEHARPEDGADLERWSPIDSPTRVLRRLAKLASTDVRRVVACLARLVRNAKSSLSASGSRDEIRTILGAGLRCADAAVRDDALEAFHKLGSLGFRAREILPLSDDLDDPAAIPYFTWDHPMTVAEIRKRLTEGSEGERHRMLGQILREARDGDVWKFTTPQEVLAAWPHVEKHLGRRKGLWELLLSQWKEQGLLVG